MERSRIGAGALVRRAIIDQDNDVPPRERIGFDLAQDRQRFTVTDSGIVVVPAGFFAPRTKPAVLALTQICAAAALFVVVTPFVEHISVSFGWKGWLAIVWTAVSGTIYGFLVQAWAQKSTTSTHAAVILGLEGLFAAVFGLAFDMDALTWRFGVGAALILAGVLVIELAPARGGAVAPVAAMPRAD